MPEFRPALSHSTAHLADTNAAIAIEQLLVNLARHSLAKVVAQGSHLGAIAGRPWASPLLVRQVPNGTGRSRCRTTALAFSGLPQWG